MSARLFVLGSCLLLTGCGQSLAASATATPVPIPTVGPRSSIAAAPTSSAAASEPPQPSTTPAPRFTNDNWSAVVAAPAENRGASVAITGKVFNLEQDQTREAVQVWTDPARQTGNTVVVFLKAGAPPIKKDDMVRAQGALDGEFTGKSDSGEVLHLPRVQAMSISVLGPNGAAPTDSVAGVTAVSSASPAATATRAAGTLAPGLYRVHDADPNGLNIRTGPALNQPKIGVVHDGGLLQVVSSQPGATYVQISGDGFTGYGALAYLSGPLGLSSPALAKLAPK